MAENRRKKTSSKSSSAAGTKKTAAKSASPSASGKKRLTVAQRRELERQQQITQILVTVGCLMVALILTLTFVLIHERQNGGAKTDYTTTATSSNTVDTVASGVYPASKDYTVASDGEQLKKPKSGEEVAILKTSMGTIKIRLFPKYAPTAVENFKTLIKNGYYNGLIFHRVINDFMIQTGMGNGSGCSFEGYDSFEDEFGRNLYNIRGAVSMANAGANTNGSQFFIVQTKQVQYYTIGDRETFLENGGAEWAADAYEERGGTVYLDGQFREKGLTRSGHTVFGQVYSGMKVVDKIAAVETDGNDKPLEDVVIEKAYLETVE